jgi:hypothetical protein
MASGSGNKTNTSRELVIYEATTWDLIHAGEDVKRTSTMVCNPPAWITQLIARVQKAEEHFRPLPEPKAEEDMLEIDISDMCNY